MRHGVESVQRETVAGEGEFGERTIAQAPVQLQGSAVGSSQSQLGCAADEAARGEKSYAPSAARAFLKLPNGAVHAGAKRRPALHVHAGCRRALPVQQERFKQVLK